MKVTATDGSASVSDTFDIVVRAVAPATEGALVSNIGQFGAGFHLFPSLDLAQEFTTGTNEDGYTLSSIELLLSVTGDTDFPTVKLFSGSATGTAVAALTPPATAVPDVRTAYTYTTLAGAPLAKETNYWVVAEGGRSGWSHTGADEDATPAPGWSIADTFESRAHDSTGAFTPVTFFTNILQLRVNGVIGNAPATGAPVVTAPNVFRVPAVLSVDLSGITDDNGVTNIATTATYNWQRFNSTGVNLDTDNIGTGSTYTLTDTDADKTLKVVVNFTDDASNSEGPLTSTPTSAITAAASCTTPSYVGGATQVWTAKVGVGKNSDSYGYYDDTTLDFGSLDDDRFSISSNNYQVDRVFTLAGPSLAFSMKSDLTSDELRTVVLHICDQPFAFSVAGAPSGGSTYAFNATDFPGADLDWSPHAERTIYLSQDTVSPEFSSATVNGTTLVMTFSEPLGAAASLANTAFTVKKTPDGGTQTTLTLSSTAPVISGSTVTLTLATASSVSATDTNVLVSYTKPTSGTANKIVDAFGNETATFTDQPVGNLLADSTPPELANANTAVLAADGLTLTLTYNEALRTTSVPVKDVFTVNATPMGGNEETIDLAVTSGVSVTGSTVVLKLARPMAHNDGSVKVTYAKPTTGAVIEDATGNDAAGFTDQAVTNNSTVPRVSIEAVYPDATRTLAPPVFRFTRSNAGTAPLTLNLTGAQDEGYISLGDLMDPEHFSIRERTIPANQTAFDGTFGIVYGGHTSGNLTLTVAGGDDHLPALAPDNSATVLIKPPESGSVARVSQPQGAYSVEEGDVLNVGVTAVTGVGVARPRKYFTVAIYTDAGTATINVDYNHISQNIPFPVNGWTATGDGAYTQTPPVAVQILDDDEHEADETFTIILQNTPGVSFTIVPDRTPVTATIIDDDALGVAGVSVTSTPAGGVYYLAGETVSFTVAINGAVTVTGTPQFTFELGGQTRQAAYTSVSDTKELVVFTYTVVSGDDDHDGISWSGNALGLNGGAIKFLHAEPAQQIDAQLGHAGQAALADHKVDATKPTLVSASLSRTTMTLTFSEELNPTGPAASAFKVKVNGGAGVAPMAASLSGRVVTLTLGTAARHDQTVTVSYAPPATNKLQDPSGKEVDAFTDASVENEAFMLDCSDPSAVWCSDLEFSDQTAENWGWAYLKYGRGYDPPASLSDEDFTFQGVDYTVVSMELRPGTHPVMPNAWSTWQQGYSSFNINIKKGASLRGNPAEDHYRNWVLHLERLALPFKDALPYNGGFLWVRPEIQEIFNDWTPSLPNRIGIQEVAATGQTTNPLLPWPPMQVDASPQGPDGLRINWAKPAWTNPGLPEPTEYIVQWKLATASWDDPADVSEREVAAGSNFHSLTIDGLTSNTFYSVRVIATNAEGNGPPSRETLGRPQDQGPQLLAQTVNGQTLTLRFSDRLATSSVPAATSFVVMADGGLIAVNSVAIRGQDVTLTLNRAVTAANSVLVRYDKPTVTSGVFLQDNSGNHAQVARHLELLPAINATLQSTVQPLTAQFTSTPASHNGRDPFTFDIEFSEPVWIGTGLARDDMLEITGGTVVSAPWKDRRSDKITVHVRPDGDGDIVIVLPGNRTCAGIISAGDSPGNAGAPCAIGNRVLTNAPTATIMGP